jgi:hypothetical protein
VRFFYPLPSRERVASLKAKPGEGSLLTNSIASGKNPSSVALARDTFSRKGRRKKAK